MKQLKKRSTETDRYGRESISKAAEEAVQRWTSEREKITQESLQPKDPVKTLRGMLKHVKKPSVELQHEARKTRAAKART